MPHTDAASRVIAAPPARVFAALVDRAALTAWLPPAGMTARFEHFDPSPGGSYRLVLTYLDGGRGFDGGRSLEGGRGLGKTTPDADVVDVRYVDVVDGVRVVQAVDFVSDDPGVAGTMTMTWTVTEVDGGTHLDVVAEDVPDGIAAADHAAGIASSLANLAAHLER